jgi:hypothetical protein
MARVHALVGVMVCLGAVLIGCKSTDLMGVLTLNQDASSQTVNASLNVVADNTRLSLENTHKLSVVMEQEGPDKIYISSTTKPGNARFKLVLTRDRSGPTEKTNVRVEWVDARDGAFGLHLLGDLSKV